MIENTTLAIKLISLNSTSNCFIRIKSKLQHVRTLKIMLHNLVEKLRSQLNKGFNFYLDILQFLLKFVLNRTRQFQYYYLSEAIKWFTIYFNLPSSILNAILKLSIPLAFDRVCSKIDDLGRLTICLHHVLKNFSSCMVFVNKQ